jgi:hypothetical protein
VTNPFSAGHWIGVVGVSFFAPAEMRVTNPFSAGHWIGVAATRIEFALSGT